MWIMNEQDEMNWDQRILVDPVATRRTMATVVVVVFACAAGVAFLIPFFYVVFCRAKGC